ncbi:MAG: 3-oxoacyl-ACP synthase, partial [Mesorhizobium sp.]
MSASLDIESIGMVTAVGLDAPSSCAAMRARLDGFQETQFIGAKATALIGAPVT